MPAFLAAARRKEEASANLGRADLLPRHPTFRADDLDRACEYLSDAVARHRLTYLGPDHRLDLRHRRAGLGQVVFNALQFGGNVRVDAPDFPDYYLLQFMLEGGCRVRQAGHCYDMTAGSIAVINPRQPFEKSWSPSGRQLMLRIERRLLDRELIAWTGREPRGPIEFDQSRTFAFAEAATLTRVVRMLCDDLRGGSSALDHPLIRDRFASTLASQRAGVTTGVSPLPRHDPNGATASAAVRSGASRAGGSRTERRFGHLGRRRARLRLAQPIHSQLQSPFWRTTVGNAAPGRRALR